MNLPAQINRLIALGIPEIAGISETSFRELAVDLPDHRGALLAIHPMLVPASKLSEQLKLDSKKGFVRRAMV